LCIGIGNPYRSDDAVGLILAQQLHIRNLAGVNVIDSNGEGLALMESWANESAVILLDAIVTGGQPGTIHRINAWEQPVPPDALGYSTHHFSIAEAIELARTLHQLPDNLIIYGIEGESYAIGEGLSPVVQASVPEVLRQIEQEITEVVLS
jgi:hydrogenase maturation protease